MLTYAPNINWLFRELPFPERPAAVARLGFTAIEFGFPSHADLAALKAAQEELGLQIVLFNQDVPVWDRANRGYLVDPSRAGEFKRTLDEALEIVRELNVLKVMLPAGVELPDLTREEQRDCMLANLRYAAPLAAQVGALLTIEMLNPQDNPGYFLSSSQEAIEIVRLVNHPSFRFQLDSYHVELMEGGLVEKVCEYSEWIGHIQFADCPGRHEPGTGAIDFTGLAAAIESAGYKSYIGLEYNPLGLSMASLRWASQKNN